jgi:hypothetical protein
VGDVLNVTASTSTVSFDPDNAAGCVVMLLATDVTTFNIGSTTNAMHSTMLFIRQAGGGNVAFAWPTNVSFGGPAPDTSTTAAGLLDVIQLVTYNHGLTWYAFVLGRGM